MGARAGIGFIVAGVLVAAMGFILDSISFGTSDQDKLGLIFMYWIGIGIAGIGGPIAWKRRSPHNPQT